MLYCTAGKLLQRLSRCKHIIFVQPHNLILHVPFLWIGISLSHWTFLERKLCWKVHTSCQSKRICVKHRVVLIINLVYRGVRRIGAIHALWCRWRVHWLHRVHWRLALHTRWILLSLRMRLVLIGLRIWSGAGRVMLVWIWIFKHIRVGIVLLLYSSQKLDFARSKTLIYAMGTRGRSSLPSCSIWDWYGDG